jgi:hypothetical protein
MNHINLDKDIVDGLIEEARWDKVGIQPTGPEQEIVEEATEIYEEEAQEELTLEDLEALLSVFPDHVLEEHVVTMANVLNEAFEEVGEVVEEEYEEYEEDDSSDLIDSIVDQTLEDLAADEE